MAVARLRQRVRPRARCPDLLRAVAADLVRHDREMAVGWDDAYWAEQVVLRNTMDGIGSWLAPRRLSSRGGAASADPQADSEAEVVGFAWNVPWERARREPSCACTPTRRSTCGRIGCPSYT